MTHDIYLCVLFIENNFQLNIQNMYLISHSRIIQKRCSANNIFCLLVLVFHKKKFTQIVPVNSVLVFHKKKFTQIVPVNSICHINLLKISIFSKFLNQNLKHSKSDLSIVCYLMSYGLKLNLKARI